ncbi:hypothetical protein [Nocardia sp. 852002-20019_SCH5090214]|uniref:hypothetical protein n=1 Tax=Nocardia sp. 852002-20019_SCH5090214 TaxID=1834087 RepID=UPI0012EA66F4|nr:hypothetical protein [Nocardia sp. 852002-20019_SCH5090214]
MVTSTRLYRWLTAPTYAAVVVAAWLLLYWPWLRQLPLPQPDGAQICRGAEAIGS